MVEANVIFYNIHMGHCAGRGIHTMWIWTSTALHIAVTGWDMTIIWHHEPPVCSRFTPQYPSAHLSHSSSYTLSMMGRKCAAGWKDESCRSSAALRSCRREPPHGMTGSVCCLARRKRDPSASSHHHPSMHVSIPAVQPRTLGPAMSMP